MCLFFNDRPQNASRSIKLTTATVPVKLNPLGGSVYVSAQDGQTSESTPTTKTYGTEPPAPPSDIQVVNHADTKDRVTVSGLTQAIR